MRTKQKIAADVLGVIVAVVVAILCRRFDVRPGVSLDLTEVLQTAVFFVAFIAVAAYFIKEAWVDIAKLLRESAEEVTNG